MSIENHEWSDGQLSTLMSNDEEITLEFDLMGEVFDFNKQDAIAIVKHFKLNAEDLKQ